MNNQAERMANKLGVAQEQKKERPTTLEGWLQEMRGPVTECLPSQIDYERFNRMLIQTYKSNPDFRECSMDSFLAACMQSAQLGLEPGPLGLAYLIPYNNRKKVRNAQTNRDEWIWVKEVQFQIGYKGLIQLGRNSADKLRMTVSEVREKDKFVCRYGLNATFEHEPNYDVPDRGPVTKYYCFTTDKHGDAAWTVMTVAEVDEVRDKFSKSAYKDVYDSKGNKTGQKELAGPWKENPISMGKKTVIKQHFKYQPLSPELLLAVEQDETTKTEIKKDMANEVFDLGKHDYQVYDDEGHVDPAPEVEPDPEPTQEPEHAEHAEPEPTPPKAPEGQNTASSGRQHPLSGNRNSNTRNTATGGTDEF